MKNFFSYTVALLLLIIGFSFKKFNTDNYHEGDIVFQTTNGSTSKGIQLATHSKYSHCGMLVLENKKWLVYEAIQPVCKISLLEFNARGKGIVKRLKNRNFTQLEIEKLKLENKNYDDTYSWGDDKIYCSELVYKLYFNALQITLCNMRKIGDYDFSHPLVKEKMEQKYHNQIPVNEPMVAPSDLFDSDLLELVP